MRLTTLADDLADLATRVADVLPERLHAMRDAMAGLPGGHTFDVVPAHRSVLWCWEHERDLNRCRAQDLDCDGETMIVNDPTGEAAVNFDQARHDRKELERCIRHAHNVMERATSILQTYESRELTIDRAGIGRCSDCGNYFDGTGGKRLSRYKATDHMVCAMCRARRDRKSA